jgi:hypothetical protein
MLNRRSIIAAALAVAVSGCVTVANRTLPFDEVAKWRIVDVKVEYAPDAAVVLSSVLNEYVRGQIAKTSPEIVGLPVDPANPGRNVYAEKAMEISATQEAKSAVRLAGAQEVQQRFMSAFATQSTGTRPVRIILIVKQLTESGNSASIVADTRFVDPANGKILMEGAPVNVVRQPRTGYSNSVAGLIAVAVVSAVITAAENQGRSQFQTAVDQSANNLKDWLLKKEGT